MRSVTLEDINSELYRMFKTLATLRGIIVQEAPEEAIRMWVRLYSHTLIEGDVSMVMEYLMKNPVRPFAFYVGRMSS